MLLLPPVVSVQAHLSCVFINSRLVTEGVHSIAPRRCHATEPEVRSHALGCLTPADLLSLLEVKYDVITRMLYTEMLRQHYGRATLHLETPVSLLEPAGLMQDKCLFIYLLLQVGVPGRPCCHGNKTRRRRGLKTWPSWLWVRGTCSV